MYEATELAAAAGPGLVVPRSRADARPRRCAVGRARFVPHEAVNKAAELVAAVGPGLAVPRSRADARPRRCAVGRARCVLVAEPGNKSVLPVSTRRGSLSRTTLVK
jgi:hypothetical protein